MENNAKQLHGVHGMSARFLQISNSRSNNELLLLVRLSIGPFWADRAGNPRCTPHRRGVQIDKLKCIFRTLRRFHWESRIGFHRFVYAYLIFSIRRHYRNSILFNEGIYCRRRSRLLIRRQGCGTNLIPIALVYNGV